MGIFNTDDLFVRYSVELQFRDRLMGGIPKNPEVIEGWLRSKMGLTDSEEIRLMVARTLMEQGVEVSPEMTLPQMLDASKAVANSKSTNGFKSNEDGLYIESRQLKAGLKECVNILFAGDRWGRTKKGPRSYFAERAFPAEDVISLGRQEPDGLQLVVGHVSGPAGPRSTLTYHEYVERPRLVFDFLVLQDSISEWPAIWTLFQENGLGALRSQGFGRFDIEKWELAKATPKRLVAVN